MTDLSQETGAPPRMCDRCGEPEWKHSGIEGFCPFISTFRAVSRSRDTERLDWMQARCDALTVPGYPRIWDVNAQGDAVNFTPTCDPPDAHPSYNIRSAIDAAMSESKTPHRCSTRGPDGSSVRAIADVLASLLPPETP